MRLLLRRYFRRNHGSLADGAGGARGRDERLILQTQVQRRGRRGGARGQLQGLRVAQILVQVERSGGEEAPGFEHGYVAVMGRSVRGGEVFHFMVVGSHH